MNEVPTDGEVRRATAADVPAATASMASAFGVDPVVRWLSGQAHTEARMRPFWKALVRESVRPSDHLSFVWRDGQGAAIWRDVDRWKVRPAEVVRTTPLMLAALRFRLPTALRFLAGMEEAHPTEPHVYLEFIGTHADRQGQGGGSALLAPMLRRCDERGTAAYLESSNPRNVPFYARHGFAERPALTPVKGGPTVTPMWREPR